MFRRAQQHQLVVKLNMNECAWVYLHVRACQIVCVRMHVTNLQRQHASVGIVPLRRRMHRQRHFVAKLKLVRARCCGASGHCKRA